MKLFQLQTVNENMLETKPRVSNNQLASLADRTLPQNYPHYSLILGLTLMLLCLPTSTSTCAVPALSSYSLLKSSTEVFFRLSFRGANRSGSGLFACSRLGMRLSNPGLIVLGFAAGTGRLVDLEGGRPVVGFMYALAVVVLGAG